MVVPVYAGGAGAGGHVGAGAMSDEGWGEANVVRGAGACGDEVARAGRAVEGQGIPGLKRAKGVKADLSARGLEGRKIRMIDLERAVDPPAW